MARNSRSASTGSPCAQAMPGAERPMAITAHKQRFPIEVRQFFMIVSRFFRMKVFSREIHSVRRHSPSP